MAYLLAAARLALAQQLAAAAAAARQGLAGSLCQLSSQPTHALLPAGPAGTTAVADAVGCSPGVVCSFGDAALAALPQLLDDSLLLDELTARWWGRCRGLAAADDTVRGAAACAGTFVHAHCLLSVPCLHRSRARLGVAFHVALYQRRPCKFHTRISVCCQQSGRAAPAVICSMIIVALQHHQPPGVF